MEKKMLAAIGVLLILIGLQAAKLENIPTTVYQPDGTRLDCFASGDEFFNRLHDANGYTIIQSQLDGSYYFAVEENGKLVPSKLLPGKTNPQLFGIRPNLVISELAYQKARTDFFGVKGVEQGKAPHEGIMNNIVVYIRFAGQTEFTQVRTFFDGILNDQTLGANSVYNYYKEVSYNKLDLVSSHFPTCAVTTNLSYQDAQPIGYYQPYNASTNPIGYQDADRTAREHTLLKNAVAFVATQVSGSSLNIDADNDGNVDNVTFIIKGNVGAWASLLWPHRWSLYTEDAYIGTKRVYDYIFMLSEASGYLNRKVFCHELFHALGAPDLYHYSSQTTNTMAPVQDWDIMESGSGHMGAYMKWKYADSKWITEIPLISQPGRYTVQPLSSSASSCYKIASPNSSTEFFVVENRRKSGTFEGDLPGSGLLAYRINPAFGGNADGNDEVYIYRPNGTPTVTGNIDGANFPTGTGINMINDTTNPKSLLTDQSNGGLDISNIIVNADNSITFDLLGGPTSPIDAGISAITTPVSAPNLTATETIVTVIKNFGTTPITTGLTVSYKLDNGVAVNQVYTGSTIAAGDSTNFTFSQKADFSAAGNHTLEVFTTLANDGVSENNLFTKIVTNIMPLTLPFMENFNASTTLPAGWENVSAGGNPLQIWEFGTHTSGLAGTGNYAYLNSDDYGSGNSQNADLISPLFDLSSNSDIVLSFTHYFRFYTNSSAALAYSIDGGANWTQIQQWTEDTVNPATFSQIIDAVAGKSAVKFKWNYTGSWGYHWDVDNISISGSSSVGESNLPLVTELLQNYPNPFNPATTIGFALAAPSELELGIYNIKGELVKTLVKGQFKAGNHKALFDASGYNSGMYFYRLSTKEKVLTGKMMLIK